MMTIQMISFLNFKLEIDLNVKAIILVYFLSFACKYFHNTFIWSASKDFFTIYYHRDEHEAMLAYGQ